MIGRRRRSNTDVLELNPGDYVYKNQERWWYGCTPNGLLVNLSGHAVLENEDLTISVSPSIAVSNGDGGKKWHGFLEFGSWQEC